VPALTSGRRSWRGPLLLAASATTLSFIVLAGLGEWAVRYRERTRSSVPGTMSQLFYRHTRLMHGLVRGTDYFGWVRVGRQGFRGARDVSESHPDSVFRIIAVGGSTTFDANTSGDSSAWPARLEQILNSVDAPQHFEVLNAGVPGFQVFDDLVRLELELHRYKPNLIILYQGHNDLFNTLSNAGAPKAVSFDPRPGETPAVYPWQLWLERNSLLYHKLRSKWEAIQYRASGEAEGARAKPADYNAGIDRGSEGFGRNVRLFLAVAQSLGIRVVVPQVVYAKSDVGAGADSVVVALWRRALPFAPPAVVWTGYARYDSVARVATTAHTGTIYVPASDPALWLLDGYAEGDPIHFNNSGSWRLARHLANAIRALPELQHATDTP
jgi:lysophospholipase L1-like esterase